jgi:carboxyvinyl-carboxyphosphonate phosphorylmutase
MHWDDRREKFRAVLEGVRCTYPASVYDPMTARLAADIGYEIGMFSGSVASLTILGAPDIVVLTLSEFVAQALRINRAGDLPLMVDADHGYGNALNVKRTVEELETAGVCGLSIEDTALPPVYGSPEKPQVLSIEEGVGKMRAALAGRRDKRLVIAGRSSSIGITGLADTIARAKAYEAAGVDAFFIAGAKTRAEIEAVADAIKIPLVLGGSSPELQDMDFLSAQRVRICTPAHLPIVAAMRAAYETLKALRDGVKPKDVAGLPSAELMKQATRDADYRRWMKEFLGG